MNENQNLPPNVQGEQKYIIARSPKSMGIGLMLTLLFGPIGLLYATISGGIIMIIVDSVFALIGLFTFGFSLFITIPTVNLICMAWAYVKINKYNAELLSGKLNTYD